MVVTGIAQSSSITTGLCILLVQQPILPATAARTRGQRIGRPKAIAPDADIQRLLSSGLSMQATAKELGVSATTICRRAQQRSKDIGFMKADPRPWNSKVTPGDQLS